MAGAGRAIATEDRASPAYAWYVVGVLFLAYTVSYIDRTILTLLVKPIRTTLAISDFEISLLHGLAFAVFYTVLGVPIAWLADRASRRGIIAAGIFAWSFMTALCGLARSFPQMFLARVGVGVGEAALSPAAYSMIADYFPPKDLTRALSVYATGVYVGSGLALIVGGAVIAVTPALDLPGIGRLEPWQVVFLAVGLPGLAVVALMATVREPPRRNPLGAAGDPVPWRKTIATVAAHRGAYGFHMAGYALLALLWSGCATWIPTFFIRTFQWSPGQVGLAYGLATLICGTGGLIAGGWHAGRMRAAGRTDANVRIGVVSALAVLPLGVAAPLMPNAVLAIAVYCGFIFWSSYPFGGAAAALQEITPNRMRAQVSSVYLFVVNLAGIGAGPAVVAFFTDYLFRDDAAVRYSLALTVLVSAPAAALLLRAACPPYRARLAMLASG
jgi:MFS family permease